MYYLSEYGTDTTRYNEAKAYNELTLALITAQYKDIYQIATACEEKTAQLSGKLRYDINDASEYPTVGDYVMVANNKDALTAQIKKVLRRTSLIERKANGKQGTQLIAANVQTVFICMALNENFSLNRLERYLAGVYTSGAEIAVILTKTDLCEDYEYKKSLVIKAAPYAKVYTISAFDEKSVASLEGDIQKGQTIAFIGSSGVGKSTLINALLEEDKQKTAKTGANAKGRHTTTSRQMLLTKNKAVVIDTPGMREFGVESVDLDTTFSDIELLARECRFSDCTHTSEPGCAVICAINNDELDPRRLESYQKLKREAKYVNKTSRQIEEEKFNFMFKDKGGMKKIREYNRKNNKRGKF